MVTSSNPYIDKFFYYDKDLIRVINDLKREDYDYVIDLDNNFRSVKVKRSLKRRYGLIVGLHLDHWNTPLSTWFRYCNRLFRPRLLLCGNHLSCLRRDIHPVLLLLAKTNSLFNSDVTIHNGRHEEVPVDNHGQFSWIIGVSGIWSMVEC